MAKGSAKSRKKKKSHAAEQSSAPVSEVSKPAEHLPEKISFFAHYRNIIKTVWAEVTSSFREDIDPDKVVFLKKETRAILTRGLVFAAVTVGVSALFVGIEYAVAGKIYPGTTVAGIDFSFAGPDEVKAQLQARADEFLKTPFTFTLGDNSQTFTAEELGVKADLDQTIQSVPEFKFATSNPLLVAGAIVTKRDYALQYRLDTDKIMGAIEGRFSLGDKRAKNARLVLKDDQFVIEPESAGQAINGGKFLAELRAGLNSFSSAPIALELQSEQPRLVAAQLEAQKDRLIGLLDNKITMYADDADLDLKFSNHLDAIEYKERTRLKFNDLGFSLPIKLSDANVQIEEGSPVKLASALELAVNGGKIASYLDEELISKIEVPTSGVSIIQDDAGKITIEGKGEDGRTVARNRLIAGIDLAANNNLQDVPVPVITEKAPVKISDNLKSLGINELLATGYTTYYGSPANRMFNIKHGIQKYNGILVKPGEEFSFNEILGEVDGSTGFLPEKIIKKGKIEMEFGGGICQVSTTLYRALLIAGLPITERNPHTLKVSYYSQVLGPGLDATIYPGVSDVKFINDTPASILIQSYAEEARAYFKLYGTNDGRTAELDGPYGSGLHYKWYRTVNKGGEVIKETIVSNYKPLPPPDPPPAPPPALAAAPSQG